MSEARESDGGRSEAAAATRPSLVDRLPEFWREHAGALEPWLSALEGGVDELAVRVAGTREGWGRERSRELLERWFPGAASRNGESADAGTLGALRRWLAARGIVEEFPTRRRVFPGVEVVEARRGTWLVSRAKRAAAVVVWGGATGASGGPGAIPAALVPVTCRVQVILPSSEEGASELRPGTRLTGQLLWDSEAARAAAGRAVRPMEAGRSSAVADRHR